VTRLVQSVLIVLVGGVLIAITASGRFTSYVKPGFGPLLIAGGVVLMLAGVSTLILTVRADHRADRRSGGGAVGEDPDIRPADVNAAAVAQAAALTGELHVDAHGHRHSSRAPWLIMAPILVLLLAPPALGADAVSRSSGSQAVAGLQPVTGQVVTGDGGYAPNDGAGSAPGSDTSGGMTFPALPDTANPPLALKATVLRALYDSSGSVTKRPVTVIGFLTPAGTGFPSGYSIARIAISCCAADANALQLHVDGAAPFPTNTWVRAVVTAIPGSATTANNYVPSVKVTSIVTIAEPSDPYEH
jgi:uncharacterized repeat protein (TIGR03943 family)